jgi:hypothetical protein
MFHACAIRFDVTEILENFLVFRWTKQGPDESVEILLADHLFVLQLCAALDAAASQKQLQWPTTYHQTTGYVCTVLYFLSYNSLQ